MKKYQLESGEEIQINESQICYVKQDGDYEILFMANGNNLKVKQHKASEEYHVL